MFPPQLEGSNTADLDELCIPVLCANLYFSLSHADRLYRMLSSKTFFERNLGLGEEFGNVSVSVQPKIGSGSAPTYQCLLQFMTKNETKCGFPRKGHNGKETKSNNNNNVALTTGAGTYLNLKSPGYCLLIISLGSVLHSNM